MSLQLENISVTYGQGAQAHTAVHGVSLALNSGQIGALIGPSGCGKSSLLRAVAGLQAISSGSIRYDGQLLSSPSYSLPPEVRGVGMVFQDYALFPHMTVAGNIRFGLKHLSRSAQDARIQEVLSLVSLTALAERLPHALSGGQQQRVALARALARKPVVLLLDEPFSSLDAAMREHLAQEVRQILKAAGTTALLVTHDQSEAFAVADQVGVMQLGYLEQWDSPEHIYQRPASHFVADFVGDAVLLDTNIQASPEGAQLRTAVGQWHLPSLPAASSQQRLLLRAESVRLYAGAAEEAPFSAQILSRQFRGGHHLYRARLADAQEILLLGPDQDALEPGACVGLRLAAGHQPVLVPERSA